MGFPMAGHLKAKGYEVTVYNRTAAKSEAWVQKHGGQSAATPGEAARGADSWPCASATTATWRRFPPRRLEGMKKGAILIDHTTASADARATHLRRRRGERGIDFIDAPVSGGQAGAENGKLTVMCGGDAAPFERAKPVMDSYAKAVTLLGGAGRRPAHQDGQPDLHRRPRAGALGRRSPSPRRPASIPSLVLDVISKGAAQSWQMENRGKTMVERKFDFGFAVDWMRKDLGHLPRRGQAQRREPSRHRARGPVLRRRPEGRRQPLRHLLPHHPPLTRFWGRVREHVPKSEEIAMKLTLYYSPGACSLGSHIALEESGLPYEAIRISTAAGAAALARVPEDQPARPRAGPRGGRQGAGGEPRHHGRSSGAASPRRAYGPEDLGTGAGAVLHGVAGRHGAPRVRARVPYRALRGGCRLRGSGEGERPRDLRRLPEGDRPPPLGGRSRPSATASRSWTPTCWCSTAGATATAFP